MAAAATTAATVAAAPDGLAASSAAHVVAARFPAHSLALSAQRRLQQLLAGLPGASAESCLPPAFAGSALLSPAQGTTLLLNLPSPGSVAETELVFATWQQQGGDGTTGQLRAMHEAVRAAGCAGGGGAGASSAVVLVRTAAPKGSKQTTAAVGGGGGEAAAAASSSVFGAFSPQGWLADGATRGTPKTFLFSATHDRKLPFHGRDTGGGGCVRATADALVFGAGDLVLAGERFERCSSALEHTFGFGMQPDCPEAGSFLAGAPSFRAEEVEVWAVRNLA